MLNGLQRVPEGARERIPDVGSVVGPTTILRMIRYISGQGDAVADRPERGRGSRRPARGACVGQEPLLQRFVQPHELAQAQLTVVSRKRRARGPGAPRRRDPPHFAESRRAQYPALKEFELADRRPGAAAREDGAGPRADARRELRPDGRHHLRRVLRGVPQRHRAPDGDDPVALRDPRDVPGDARSPACSSTSRRS